MIKAININGHDFCHIPAGMACLGSSYLDPYSSPRERPLREIYISELYISRFPTTRDQLGRYLRDVGAGSPEHVQLSNEFLSVDPQIPATGVSWELAAAYCRWLSDRSSLPISLPSEAEWEKAARGADDRIWPWGDTFDASMCVSQESGCGLLPVEDRADSSASPFGCSHMAGGVWEWCLDFYHEFSLMLAAPVDPLSSRPSARRVVKGGSAFCTKEVIRPACRDWTNSHNQGGGDDGFRVCYRPWQG